MCPAGMALHANMRGQTIARTSLLQDKAGFERFNMLDTKQGLHELMRASYGWPGQH